MSLIEKYVSTLTHLTGDAFEDEVAARLQTAIVDFQTISTKPNGDGGVDGISDGFTVGYCCYGPEYDAFKDETEINGDIIEKFRADLRRILELASDGEKGDARDAPGAKHISSNPSGSVQTSDLPQSAPMRKKGKLKHRENKALYGIMPTGKRLKHVRLIVNRYESNKLIKPLNNALSGYRTQSQRRFVEDDVTITIEGPKELANKYWVDELTLNRARQRRKAEELQKAADLVSLKDPKDFEHKIDLLKKLRPNKKSDIDELATIWREDWRLSLACEEDLYNMSSGLHYALEQNRRVLLSRIKELMLVSDQTWKSISTAEKLAEDIFRPSFHEFYGDMFLRFCHGEVSRLIGECPIRFEADIDSV